MGTTNGENPRVFISSHGQSSAARLGLPRANTVDVLLKEITLLVQRPLLRDSHGHGTQTHAQEVLGLRQRHELHDGLLVKGQGLDGPQPLGPVGLEHGPLVEDREPQRRRRRAEVLDGAAVAAAEVDGAQAGALARAQPLELGRVRLRLLLERAPARRPVRLGAQVHADVRGAAEQGALRDASPEGEEVRVVVYCPEEVFEYRVHLAAEGVVP